MKQGIAASAGIAISKIYKLEKPSLEVVETTANVDEEIANLEAALEATKSDILAIKEQSIGRLSDEEAAIFDAHIAVCEDPEFVDQIIQSIKDTQAPAAKSVEVVSEMFAGMFDAMEDEYFRERAADIRDVAYRLKAHTLGIKIPNLTLIDEEVVIAAHDLTPSDTAQLNKKFVKGFVTEIGGRTSHSAIMARSLEIPAIVGIGAFLDEINTGDTIVLDALSGNVYINPLPEVVSEFEQKQKDYAAYRESLQVLVDKPSITLDGRHVELAGNIGTPEDVEAVLENGGEGVGLYRTEFLYMNATQLPTEEEQFEAYKTVLEKMGDKRVVIRTLDIGGDKELSYLKLPEEMNPFLGYRAIRLCLDRPEIFRVQLRALLRASVYGTMAIMFPMVATIQEFRAAKALFDEEKENLLKEGVAVSDNIELGIMVEIPATAVLAEQIAKEVDFFSIGTNDLIQYSMAADRMNQDVSYLYQPYNPSILNLIKMTIDGAHKHGKWVGMCGEMAGEQMAVPVLLGLGLDEFSMSATSILPARKLVTELSYEAMQKLANQCLAQVSEEEVIALIKKEVSFD